MTAPWNNCSVSCANSKSLGTGASFFGLAVGLEASLVVYRPVPLSDTTLNYPEYLEGIRVWGDVASLRVDALWLKLTRPVV